MNGLNLETPLRLLRVAPGAWASLGLIALILALMTWTSWGSRRALRKCLVLSIAVHVGLILYGGTSPLLLGLLRLGARPSKADEAVAHVRLTPTRAESDRNPTGSEGRPDRKLADWDRGAGPVALGEPARLAPRPDPSPEPIRPENPASPPPIVAESVAPRVDLPAPPALMPTVAATRTPDAPPEVAPVDPAEVAAVPPAPVAADSVQPSGMPADADLRSRARPAVAAASRPPNRPPSPAPIALPPASPREPAEPARAASIPPRTSPPSAEAPAAVAVADAAEPTAPSPSASSVADVPAGIDRPGADVRRLSRPATVANPAVPPIRRPSATPPPLELARATPGGPSGLPSMPRPEVRRPLGEVPSVYRSRLDPNRVALAQRAGASPASELAVERALDWLARHQDADGRWDGGTYRTRDGAVFGDDDSFTVHCPAGEVCFGECFYPEADTALTGLALLAYLGAGYTHVEGKHASSVGRGLDFLLRLQKPDGDLRGSGVSVGMYCHSMATLALCEAYALTGDSRLRLPVEKAVAFLIRARSGDGMAWRYGPGAPDSDTSILGWAVMALKSAKVVGIPIPSTTQAGISSWLKKVGSGRDGGLARYQPGDKITPTMTAEAWACRQFLELGGPGRASDEAAAFLLGHKSDGGEFNAYYLYYGTLAMYQHGGEPWAAWNARVRDDVVRRQRSNGHQAGSWDPDDSQYGSKGGRIYETALATLTLEVYYRFLRLYQPAPAPSPPMAPGPGDLDARRARFEPKPPGR